MFGTEHVPGMYARPIKQNCVACSACHGIPCPARTRFRHAPMGVTYGE
jgi:hypothetical protein